MGKLIFYYGTMGSSKTANALMMHYKYKEKGKHPWLIKPSTDTRDDYRDEFGKIITCIKSRIGLQANAQAILPGDDIFKLFLKQQNIGVIVCDEAQFLTAEQVEQLRKIIMLAKIDVLCYGLRTDFKTQLFIGSKRLFELSDSIIELENICDCGHTAIINAKIDSSGKIIIDGEQIDIGGDSKYKALCWHCYNNELNKIKNKTLP